MSLPGIRKINRSGKLLRAGIGMGIFLLSGFFSADCGNDKGSNAPAALILATAADPAGGTYNSVSPPTITLTANRPATIYYSVDGRTPGPGRANTLAGDSPLTGIPITQDTTLKFFAIDQENNEEAVKTEVYVINQPPLTNAVPTGGGYPGAIAVELLADDPTAVTYYTLDGTDPTPESNKYVAGTPISISHEGFTILKFYSVDANQNAEDIKTERYKIDSQAPTVALSPSPGRYLASLSVTLLVSEPGTIYYTLDGSLPSLDPDNWVGQGGSTYLAKTQAVIGITRHTRIRYFAVDSVGNQSDLQEAIFMIGESPYTQADPQGGNYNQPQPVKLTTQTAGGAQATIYYTTDNSSPDPNDPADEYIAGSDIPVSAQGTTILRFFAIDTNENEEQEEVEVYLIDSIPPVTRALPAGNVFYAPQTVTLQSESEAIIYYSLNGADPEPDATNTFSGPSPVTRIVINTDTLLKFFAMDEMQNRESVRTEAYQIFYRYPEDFTWTAKMDKDKTNADWNVSKGILSLQQGVPAELGSFSSSRKSAGIFPIDDLVYLADGSGGIKVLDISYPPEPALAYSLAITDLAFNPVALGGAGAYLFSAGAGGLSVLDVGEPRVPVVTGSLSLPGSGAGRNLFISGNYLFLADGVPGVRTIRISDPTAPVSVGSYSQGVTTTDLCQDVVGAGSYLFTAFSQSGLLVLDISNPEANPLPLLASLAIPGATSLAKDGNLLLVGTSGGNLKLVNVSDPQSPGIWASLNVCGQAISSVVIRGVLAYLACGSGGLVVVNVTDPKSPRAEETYSGFGNLNRLFSDGSRIFASNTGGGLRIVGAAGLFSNPQVLSGQALSQARGVTLYRNRAYVANGSDGLVEIDLFDPTQPRLVSTVDTTEARGSQVLGNALILADGPAGIKIFDLTYPNSLSAPIATIATKSAQNLAVEGNQVFLADGSGGVKIFRITDPRYPPASPLGTVDLSDTRALSLFGNRLFVADGTAGLVVVNVADPAHPQAIKTMSVAGTAQMTASRGNYLYLAAGSAGLLIFDISDPDNPLALGNLDLLGDAQVREVKVWGDYLFLGTDRGIEVVNNSSPSQPAYVRTIAEGEPWALSLWGDYGLVAAGSNGFKVIPLIQEATDFQSPETAQSLTLNEEANNIVQGEVRPTYGELSSGEARFYLSNNGGKSWDEFLPFRLQSFTTQGSDLRFRVDLSTTDPTRAPIIKELVVLYKLAK